MKVMANREEINKTLSLLGIGLSTIGFIPGRATTIADTSIKILALALTIDPRVSIADYTLPIKGPVYLDEITVIQNYKRKSVNGYVSSQRKISEPRRENKDILKILEEWGLKIKK